MSSDTVLTEKPPITPPESIKQRSKLTIQDARDIAELMIKYRMTETEACHHIGIKPVRWFDFKTRKKIAPEFSDAQERLRAARLKNVIDSIDSAGNDRDYSYVNKRGEVITMTKPGDWRAKAWIAERVLAPERLGDRQQQPAQVNVQVFAQIDAVLSKVYAEPKPSHAVIDTTATKLLPEPSKP